MAVFLNVTVNPLHWGSLTFATLIVLAIVLRIVLPWRANLGLRVVREVLVFIPAVLLYFLVRGLVDGNEATAVRHAQQIIDLEQRLGIWVEMDLQNAIVQSPWITDLVNWVYIWAHWPVIAIVVIWLVLRHFEQYPKYRNALLISGVVGMVIFATYPVAPPRLMPGYEFVDTVTLQSSSYRVLQPPALANPYAAMPSLHFGWNLLMGIALARESPRLAIRIIGCLIPVTMFLAIVLSANHYILDAVVGGALVLVSLAVSTRLARSSLGIGEIRDRLLSRHGPDRRENEAFPLQLPCLNGKTFGRQKDGRRSPVTHDGRSASSALDVITHRPFVVAHRYANTISDLELARQVGADIVEADVWPYRGRLEVRHTKTLGPMPVLWDRWSIERGWGPRPQLEELLAALDPDAILMIDVKGRDPSAAGRIIDALRAGRPGKPVIVCSQNWDQVERFRGHPDVGLVYSIGNSRQLRRAYQRLVDEEWDAVSIQARLLDERVVRALKASVKLVMTWPVNTRESLDLVLGWGVDGITSDDLGLIAGITERRQPPAPDRAGLASFDRSHSHPQRGS